MALFTGDIKLDILGIIISIVAVIYVYFKWSFQYWKRKNIPYIEGTIPNGSVVSIYKKVLPDQIQEMYKQAKAKGWRYFGIYLYTRPVLYIMDLELVKNVMTKDFSHFTDRGLYSNPENENISGELFSIGGPQWRHIRVKLTPTFTSGKIKMMYQIIQNYGGALEKEIEKLAAKNQPIDIKDVVGCFTVDVIGSCAFGLDCNSFTDPNNTFLTMGKNAFTVDMWVALRNHISNSFPTLSKYLNLRVYPKDVEEFYNDVVRRAVAYREENNVQRKDFLQMLIDIKNKTGEGNEKPFTMDELIAQCFVFFLAGFETSSSTMTYASYELATHPEIQEKLRSEINQVLKKYDNVLTYESLKELEYLDQVIEETLRKHPPLAFLTRECTMDYKIPDSNDTVEKGTMVIIPVKGIQYDEDIYENPEEFIPERFTPENKKNRHQYAHMPFGEGPRICIGMRFGLVQTKVGLVSLLKNHKVTLSSKTKLPLTFDVNSPFVLSVDGGIWLNLEKV